MSDTTIQTLTGPSVGMQAMAPVATTEAYIHGIVGAQFGDLEFDVGKSIRWTQWFVDDIHITDVNLGEPRYWIVNWAETYPQAFNSIASINFFYSKESSVRFRKEQFRLATKNLILEDNDWCLIVDAHEGMSVDSRSLPDDYLIAPFRSFIYREITRAETAGRTHVVIPFFAFLKHDDIMNIEYWTTDQQQQQVPLGTDPVDTAIQSVGTPYYVAEQGLARLVKVSALKNPAFDWTIIDTPQAIVDTTVKVQLVSYGYAHWNEQDIVPPATEPEPLAEANDDGYRMRNMLSKIRPIASLPYGSPYHPVADDPAGLVGPWCPEQPGAPEVGKREAAFLDGTLGFATSGDIPPLLPPEGFTIVWSARGPTADDQTLVSVWDEANDERSFKVVVNWDQTMSLWTSTDGINEHETVLLFNPTIEDDWDYYRALTVYPGTSETWYMIWSYSNGEWHSLPLRSMGGNYYPYSPAPVSESIPALEADIKVGEQWAGRVYYVEVREDRHPTDGKLLWRWAADEIIPETLPDYDDNRERNWVISDSDAISPAAIVPLEEAPPTTDAAAAGILVPLYDTVFRINLRDGVWYEGDSKGNIPLVWDETNGIWAPRGVTPEDWANPDAYVAQS